MLPIFNNQYEILERLGSGLTSEVYMARSLSDKNALVAIKIYKPTWLRQNLNAYNLINDEVEILNSITHQNVVKVY